ncbi:MAG: hypothetical protein Q9188_004689 [Gyalolechia gomerana]
MLTADTGVPTPTLTAPKPAVDTNSKPAKAARRAPPKHATNPTNVDYANRPCTLTDSQLWEAARERRRNLAKRDRRRYGVDFRLTRDLLTTFLRTYCAKERAKLAAQKDTASGSCSSQKAVPKAEEQKTVDASGNEITPAAADQARVYPEGNAAHTVGGKAMIETPFGAPANIQDEVLDLSEWERAGYPMAFPSRD